MRYFIPMVLIGVPVWYTIIIFWAVFTTPTKPDHTHNIQCFTRILADERILAHFQAVVAGMAATVGAYGTGYLGCKVLASKTERQHCSEYGTITGSATASLTIIVSRNRETLDGWIASVKSWGNVFNEENLTVMRTENTTEGLEL